MITLITPTGSRPEAFALCEKWIQRQTYRGKLQWIVVDDSPRSPNLTICTMGQTYLSGPMEWRPGINTQRPNMDAALGKVKGDRIFIIEDDEYYAPDYIETMLKLLETAEIAGLSNSRYYHLKVQGWKEMGNFQHASLCHTAIRKEVLPDLYEAVHSGHYYFDIELWKKAQERHTSALISNTSLSVGMKGLPGRAGLGGGHEAVGYKGDKDFFKLRSWIGDDVNYYLDLLKKQ